jgi:hypothetical protein
LQIQQRVKERREVIVARIALRQVLISAGLCKTILNLGRLHPFQRASLLFLLFQSLLLGFPRLLDPAGLFLYLSLLLVEQQFLLSLLELFLKQICSSHCTYGSGTSQGFDSTEVAFAPWLSLRLHR